MNYSETDLRAVFGPDSRGATPLERAKSSRQLFVRSQVQLAFDSSEATGFRMTAEEALDAYGIGPLIEVASQGATPLVEKQDEPAATFHRRRNSLGLTEAQVARSAGVTMDDVKKAETEGIASPIRTLQRIAQALGLDERKISFLSGAGGDARLGVRLRQMTAQRDARRFSAAEVSALSEASWVIKKQQQLARFVSVDRFVPASAFQQSSDYRYPTFSKGYALASETRRILGLNAEEPVQSLRTLLEERLGIPLVQLELHEAFAGATIANGNDRGIVVNERGLNSNVWVRRMTLAHEIGHLLWDPDEKLDRLTVDRYDELDFGDTIRQNDPIEIRANAFAIAFLAPDASVKKIAEAEKTTEGVLCRVMETYGISATAARYHIKNIAGIDGSNISARELPQPSTDWVSAENLTIDYFEPRSTPISRRGRFAWYVARAWQDRHITGDSGSGLFEMLHGRIGRIKRLSVFHSWPTTSG